MHGSGGVEHDEVGSGTRAQMTNVVTPQRAPPRVGAHHSASSLVMPISRTARAITKAMLVTYDVPGLQSVASATVTPASSRRVGDP